VHATIFPSLAFLPSRLAPIPSVLPLNFIFLLCVCPKTLSLSLLLSSAAWPTASGLGGLRSCYFSLTFLECPLRCRTPHPFRWDPCNYHRFRLCAGFLCLYPVPFKAARYDCSCAIFGEHCLLCDVAAFLIALALPQLVLVSGENRPLRTGCRTCCRPFSVTIGRFFCPTFFLVFNSLYRRSLFFPSLSVAALHCQPFSPTGTLRGQSTSFRRLPPLSHFLIHSHFLSSTLDILIVGRDLQEVVRFLI